jgi:hypothetical protein
MIASMLTQPECIFSLFSQLKIFMLQATDVDLDREPVLQDAEPSTLVVWGMRPGHALDANDV